jgi:hypothetical protein
MPDKEKINLILALTQVENIVKITENNQWKDYLYSHLSPIKYELERQLTLLNDKSKGTSRN